ncbi:hypothetical protein, partial [Glaesserella parasuis]|uniref:hypothetical protein n=1 Tax=Glaesserella parasuis TaxID=738 RepID=UPI00271C5E2A|nr:hypothetical protein [Glaesserella parasuis]
FGFADEVIHAYATERVLALGTPKLWITLWFMLLVYYNFNIQGNIILSKTRFDCAFVRIDRNMSL